MMIKDVHLNLYFFINILVNHLKTTSSRSEQLFCSHFFIHYKIFFFNNRIENYCQKRITKNRLKLLVVNKERSQEYFANLSEDKRIQKRNYANNRIKNMSDADRDRKKECKRSYYYKRKNLVE